MSSKALGKWEINVWFDGFLWCAMIGRDGVGRYQTREEAFGAALNEKWRRSGMDEVMARKEGVK